LLLKALLSLQPDVGCPDHFAPFLGFIGDEFSKLGRRARKDDRAEVGKARLVTLFTLPESGLRAG
jgi:hypothetical protein